MVYSYIKFFDTEKMIEWVDKQHAAVWKLDKFYLHYPVQQRWKLKTKEQHFKSARIKKGNKFVCRWCIKRSCNAKLCTMDDFFNHLTDVSKREGRYALQSEEEYMQKRGWSLPDDASNDDTSIPDSQMAEILATDQANHLNSQQFIEPQFNRIYPTLSDNQISLNEQSIENQTLPRLTPFDEAIKKLFFEPQPPKLSLKRSLEMSSSFTIPSTNIRQNESLDTQLDDDCLLDLSTKSNHSSIDQLSNLSANLSANQSNASPINNSLEENEELSEQKFKRMKTSHTKISKINKNICQIKSESIVDDQLNLSTNESKDENEIYESNNENQIFESNNFLNQIIPKETTKSQERLFDEFILRLFFFPNPLELNETIEDGQLVTSYVQDISDIKNKKMRMRQIYENFVLSLENEQDVKYIEIRAVKDIK